MNIQKHFLGTVLAGLGTFALAATQTLPLPPESGYVDTESSTNILFVGFNDLTRFMNVRTELFSSLASCVQVAVGTDNNGNGDLAVDETDLVLGYDCGTWFIRDEKGDATFLSREENSLHAAGMPRLLCSPSITTQSTTNSRQQATFDVSRLFSREWNLMKITTRGDQGLGPTLGLEFKNNPFVFILK